MDVAIGKNIWFASLSTVIPATLSYVFWFVSAKVAGPDALGIASGISSLVVIISTITGLDMFLGMKRSLGMAMFSNQLGHFKQVLFSASIVVLIVSAISALLLYIPQLAILETIGIDRQYVDLVAALLIAQPLQFVFGEALIASFRSERLVMPFVIGSMVRFPILLILYFFGLGDWGVILGFSSTIFITTICFAIYCILLVLKNHERAYANLFSNAKNTIKAGLSSWIPNTMNILGYQVGIVTVLYSVGAIEAGILYIVLGTLYLTLFIVKSITRVTHPLIANIGDKNEQANIVSNSIKVAFIYTLPISTPLLFFSDNFLSLIDSRFGYAANVLTILMLNLPFVIVSEIIYYFVYGMGDLRSVLYLGLAGNIPRIVLYFWLSGVLGATGVALAFLTGSIVQYGFSRKIARMHSLRIDERQCAVLTAIPMIVGFAVWLVNINFGISIILIIFFSFLLYTKFNLFGQKELKSALFTALPQENAMKIYPLISRIMKKINNKG